MLVGFASVGPGLGPVRVRDQAPATPAREPRLAPAAHRAVDAAWRATIARDPACRGQRGPRFVHGRPTAALSALFGVLQRPALQPGRVPAALLHARGVWSPGVRMEINQVHRARSAFGVDFYLAPALDVTGQGSVPARCGPEQVAALRRQQKHAPAARRTRLLAAQQRWLAYTRFLATHPGGVCIAAIARRSALPLSAGATAGCISAADLQEIGFAANVGDRRGVVFWTVVPDLVASVTVRLDRGPGEPRPRPALTAQPAGNVVAALLPRPWSFPSSVVLRAAAGQAVLRFAPGGDTPTLCGSGC